jgi:hypothetical protein
MGKAAEMFHGHVSAALLMERIGVAKWDWAPVDTRADMPRWHRVE